MRYARIFPVVKFIVLFLLYGMSRNSRGWKEYAEARYITKEVSLFFCTGEAWT